MKLAWQRHSNQSGCGELHLLFDGLAQCQDGGTHEIWAAPCSATGWLLPLHYMKHPPWYRQYQSILASKDGIFITLLEPNMQMSRSKCAANCSESFDCLYGVAVGELQGLAGDQAEAAGQVSGRSGCGSDVAGGQDPGRGPQKTLQQAEKQEEASTSTSPSSQHNRGQHDSRCRGASSCRRDSSRGLCGPERSS